jgi:hypothetical protein
VITVDRDSRIAEAAASRGDRILAVGSNAGAKGGVRAKPARRPADRRPPTGLSATRPVLFLMSDHGKLSDEIGSRILANIRSIRARSKKPCPEWVLRGTRHFNFSDQCLMKDRLLTRIVGGAGPIDARRGLAIASECIRTFFDVHLKGAPDARFEGLPSRFSEISVEPEA